MRLFRGIQKRRVLTSLIGSGVVILLYQNCAPGFQAQNVSSTLSSTLSSETPPGQTGTSPTPTPTATPASTPKLTPTSTPNPTATPVPTPTATPKAPPMPTPTPKPTATPTPTPKPTATPTPTPAQSYNSAGCGKAVSQTGVIRDNFITVNGLSRTWNVILPDDYNPTEALPIVIGNHMNGGDKEIFMNFNLRPAGNAEKAIYIYTQAYNGEWRESCGDRDTPYFNKMLDTLFSQYCINTNRVFMFGFSWGADMTNSMACCMGDRIRAAAPLSGTYNGNAINTCTSKTPPLHAYIGDQDPIYSLSEESAVLKTFSQLQKCTGGSTKTVGAGCDGGGYADKSVCTQEAYSGCLQEVSATVIHGMAHDIPKGYESLLWGFFTKYK